MAGPPPEGATEEAARILRAAVGDRLRQEFPLAPLTSFRLGGPAALYLEANTHDDLEAVAEVRRRTDVPLLVIGKGSNLLVADEGFAGLVLRLGKGFRWAARDGDLVSAGASMALPALAGVALAHGLGGLEFGVAIPASLGGSVRMNAGAHGGSLADVLERIELFLTTEGRRVSVAAEDAGFTYRGSSVPEGGVVVAAAARLTPGDPIEIRRRMDEAREWRRATQPLAEPNCGSVFKNPPGDHAARLVEEVDGKQLTVGNARVSEKHANFIVAGPGSSAEDVRRLIGLLQERVRSRFGIDLEPEVHIVGGTRG